MSCRTTTLLWLNLHICKEFTIQGFFSYAETLLHVMAGSKADKIKERADGLIYKGTS